MLWGANTFPTHNWLPDPKYGFSVVFHIKLWWRLQTLFFQILVVVRRPVSISIATIIIYVWLFSPFLFVFGDERVICHMGA